ncbi:hypothetical protein H257_03992 [Aphanomyces astaci]|uniref:Uncharacterized protein n=1 Tax=Aphanomyces astaci TaxID=112090 RepID=W4GU03_APHAT|nr:hypothetical protein H257_03992 [Aphanomyces astaci]ETV83205.1 hypothetical protein H257_03992 [Aphanomyces astaci]|eukprot:XP_009826635.1 hypothetical protein H257_03992 [Aphanomyces astaci]
MTYRLIYALHQAPSPDSWKLTSAAKLMWPLPSATVWSLNVNKPKENSGDRDGEDAFCATDVLRTSLVAQTHHLLEPLLQVLSAHSWQRTIWHTSGSY